MPVLTINDMPIEAPSGSTILDVSKQLKIRIPTLCCLEGYPVFTSCMVCVVYDKKSDRLLPACSSPVRDGMVIETDNELVRQARKDALELLLSEHIGDCQAPCQRICPAHMNIPLMIRQISESNFDAALRTIKRDIAMPAVLGRICPAPCEKGCNRKYHDNPVAICLLKQVPADIDLARATPYQPGCKKRSGKKIAIIGSGPAGLSAAYYLRQQGHGCVIFERASETGGMLRYGISSQDLPESVLDAEVQALLSLGIEVRTGMAIDSDSKMSDIRRKYDAVVLTVGTIDVEGDNPFGVEMGKHGIKIDPETFKTSIPGVFAGGNAVMPGKLAIRSLAHGKDMAFAVDQYVRGQAVVAPTRRFNSVMGRPFDGEIGEMLRGAETGDVVLKRGDMPPAIWREKAILESKRCLHCDCRKPVSCSLRLYAEEYSADQNRYRAVKRGNFKRNVQHRDLIYEQGKCIRCGLCVRITEKAGEPLGLTFIGRGFDVRVDVPFSETLERGLQKVAEQCAAACPTGALALLSNEESRDDKD